MDEEIKKQIERLENAKFYHQMKDHWDADDFAYDTKIDIEIAQLRGKLKCAKES